jgi:hypothetical protein
VPFSRRPDLLAVEASGLFKGPPEQKLHLGVHAPQFVVGPAFEGEERPLVQAEQEGLAFGHFRVVSRAFVLPALQ